MPADDLAAFTSVFRAGDAHRVKRNRAAVSCTACQRRKSKCDRGQPCGACEKRGEPGACRFGTVDSSGQAASGRLAIQSRLDKLEELVQALAEAPPQQQHQHQQQHQQSSQVSEGSVGVAVEQGRQAPKTVSATHTPPGETEVVYRGPTSWAAIVEGIQDIRSVLQAEEDEDKDKEKERETTQGTANFGGDLLLRPDGSVDMDDIVGCLPARPDMDRLVQIYFSSRFVSPTYIHVHHFRRRYEAFLADPTSVSLLWVSILFSVLSIGATIARSKCATGSSSSPTGGSGGSADPAVYMAIASRCLVAGRYLEAKAFSVEALMVYAHSRNLIKTDSDPTIWSLYGLAIRLAQRRGYHRSTGGISSSSVISPFDAEMRRRVWNVIQSADLVFSAQLGMPSMVDEELCDVEPPTNLTDEDFDEDTPAPLPPPRPPTDPTPVLAYIFKARMCRITRRIMHHVLAVTPRPYAETLALSTELEACYATIPTCLRYRSVRSTSFADPSHAIMHRLVLRLMLLKSLCVLHRPYLTTGKGDPTYAASRETCRAAALGLLALHVEFTREFQEGGRLYEDKYMITSLSCHEFLVAAMVISLDLVESTDISAAERQSRIDILGEQHEIWLSRRASSVDARHASKVLGVILNKVRSTTTRTALSSSGCFTVPLQPNQDPCQSDETMVGMGRSPEKGTAAAVSWFSDALFAGGSNSIGGDEPLDWANIDNYLRDGPPDSFSWLDG